MIWYRFYFSVLLLLSGGFIHSGITQDLDHWETIVYHYDEWRYQIGSPSIPSNWYEEEFDDSQWLTGPGGFGYGDNDDNTILNNAFSVFIRRNFDIVDKDAIGALLLHADFDDGFVAYLNGIEVARANLGTMGVPASFDEPTPDWVEASLFQGLTPPAYSLDSDILKDGENVLAIQVHNHNNTSSDLSSNFFLSAGISNGSTSYGPTPDWFDVSIFYSSLPIIKITTPDNMAIMNEPRISAHMGVIHNGDGSINFPFDTFNAYDGRISIEYRGTSSLMFDKKGYGFETQNDDGSNNNVKLLGLPEENDWALHGPYSDKSLLRNVLTYHIASLTDRYSPRTRLCELFIDNSYEGVYVLIEKIKRDKNRVDIAKLTELDNSGDELTGGYIIKIDRNVENIPGIGWYSDFPDYKFFAYVEPKADRITTQQENYIQNYMFNFESAMASQGFEEFYLDYIDVKSLVDYFLVTEISKQIDAFKLSFYMYKDKDSNGGKLHFGPLWDFNLAYGNFDFSCSPDPDGWAYEFPDCGSWHPFWARKLLDIPNVQHLSDCRWTELREGPFQTDSLLAFIDGKVEEMGSAVDRNFERWPILGEYVWGNDFVGEDYEDELNFLKSWLVARLEWMDENMLGDCDEYISEVSDSDFNQVKIFPNPASQHLNINWLSDEPVTVKMYNLNNQLIKSVPINSNVQNSIDISKLSNGIYVLLFKSITDQNILFTKRVAVIK